MSELVVSYPASGYLRVEAKADMDRGTLGIVADGVLVAQTLVAGRLNRDSSVQANVGVMLTGEPGHSVTLSLQTEGAWAGSPRLRAFDPGGTVTQQTWTTSFAVSHL